MTNDRWKLREEAIELMNTNPEKSKSLLEKAENMYKEELKKNQYADWFKHKNNFK